MITYANLSSLFTDIITTLDKLSALQMEKLNAAKQRNLELLDHCMKQEQAVSLTLRGLEQKRGRLWRDLGLQSVALRDLPQHFPPEGQPEARRAVNRLLEQYQALRSAQEPTRILMEHRIQLIEEELARRGADQTPGGATRRGPSHTDMKV